MIRSLVFDRRWRDKCFDRLKFDIRDAQQARATWWEDYRRGYQNYRSIPESAVKSWPWKNASNLVPPMVATACEAEIRRLVMYFVQDRQYITLTGLSPGVEAMGGAEKVQQLLRWQAESELNYLQFVDSFVREVVLGGTGFGITGWAHHETLVSDVLTLGRHRLEQSSPGADPMYVEVGEMAKKSTPVDDIMDEIFGSQGLQNNAYKKLKGTPKDLDKYMVPFLDKRKRERMAEVTIDRAERLGDQVEVSAILPRVVKNQPILKPMTAERIIVPPGECDVHDADFVGIRSFVSWEWIQERWRTGEWHSDEDEKAKLRQHFEEPDGSEKWRMDKGGGHGEWEAENGAQDDQDEYVGVDTERFRARLIPIIEVKRKYDIVQNKNRFGETMMPEATITILPKHGMVTRVQYDSAETGSHRAGRRNVVSHNFVKARNEFYGISLPRMLEPYHQELKAITNMSIDSANIRTMPMIFVDHTVSLERDNLQYHPGGVIKISQPRDNVVFPQWPNMNADFELQIQRLNQYGQDLAQQGPASMGRDPTLPGGNRTARGMQILASEANFNVFYEATSLSPVIVDTWKQVHAWNAMKMDPEKEIAIFGTDETASRMVIDREHVRGEFDFRFEAGQAVLNDEMRRAMFTEAFQLTAPIAQAPPEQVPKPLWNMAREIWRQRGIPDPEKFLPQPIDHFGDPLQPSVEHEIFAMGRPVAVHPLDVDELHVQAHMAFAATEAFGRLPRSIIEAFNQHVLLHQRRIQAATGAGQGRVGSTGAQLGGNLAMQANPAINSSPGQPAVTQPDQVQGPQGGALSGAA